MSPPVRPLTVVAGSDTTAAEQLLLDGLLRAGRAEGRSVALAWVGVDDRPPGVPAVEVDHLLDLTEIWDRRALRWAARWRATTFGSRAKDAVVGRWLKRTATGPVVVLGSGMNLLPWLGDRDTLLLLAFGDPRLTGPAPALPGRARLLVTIPTVQAAADRWDLAPEQVQAVWGWRPDFPLSPDADHDAPILVAGPAEWTYGADLAARALGELAARSPLPAVRWIDRRPPRPSEALEADLERLGLQGRIEWVAADPARPESWAGARSALIASRTPVTRWCEAATEAGVAQVGFPTGVLTPLPGRDVVVPFGDVAAVADALAAAHRPAPAGIGPLETAP